MAVAVGAGIGVGVLINQLFDRVEQTIDAAVQGGLRLEMEAGAQVRQTIQDAQIAYNESLNLTMDRVDETARNTINQIAGLVQDLETRQENILIGLARRAQVAATALPFHNERPQLSAVLPRFVLRLPNDANDIRFKFQGNFEHAAMVGYAPTLTFNQQGPFHATHITNQQLEFQVAPLAVFPNNGPVRRITFSQGVLSVPWQFQNAGFLGAMSAPQRLIANFRLIIGRLPNYPGEITFNYTTTALKVSKGPSVEKRIPNQHLSSAREGGNNDHKDHLFMGTSDRGWHVEQNTSKVEVTQMGEVQYPTFVSDHGNQVVYRGGTIHKVAGSSGVLDVVIVFKQYQEIYETTEHSETVDLAWGDSKAFTHPADAKITKWKVIFNGFDGSKHEFIRSGSCDFLKVRSDSQGISLEVPKPQELDDL